MKIVVNSCCGGFCLSAAAMKRYIELIPPLLPYSGPVDGKYHRVDDTPDTPIIVCYSRKDHGPTCSGDELMSELFTPSAIKRNDPYLVTVVEELGKAASGFLSQLEILEIPDDVNWEIESYDGSEWVSEVHRTWHKEEAE